MACQWACNSTHGPALRLNAAGRAASDGIGQWLQSAEVAALRAAWTPR